MDKENTIIRKTTSYKKKYNNKKINVNDFNMNDKKKFYRNYEPISSSFIDPYGDTSKDSRFSFMFENY